MLIRTALCRGAQRAARAQFQQTRGLAAPASGSFQYQSSESKGLKFASRDLPGPVTTLALVSKAGTRYQPLPGLTEGLEKYAFKGTARRSTLRITREAELLGAELNAYHTRENLVLEAKFLRDDLPYFVELLGEVAASTEYKTYVYHEEVLPIIQMAHKRFLANTAELAINSAHALAFHRGLGTPTQPSSSTPYTKYVVPETISYFSQLAYAKPNFAIVANGAKHEDVSNWVSQFFEEVPASPTVEGGLACTEQTKYYGGEERVAHDGGNSMVIGFPGSSSFTGKSYKPEMAVLASLLGGDSHIKWSRGFSLLAKAKPSEDTFVKTNSAIYSDAGLLYTVIKGSAKSVAETAKATVGVYQKIATGEISKEDFQKAKAAAKFKELEYGQDLRAGLVLTGNGLVSGDRAYQIDEVAKAIDGVTEQSVKAAAKSLIESKASVSAVGDLFVLPYAEELGLKV